MESYCYFNGRVVPFSKAALRLNDLGVLRGYGVFDFLRTYNKKPFLLTEHLDRFAHSAEMLHLSLPVSGTDIETAIYELIEKNNFPEANFRLVLTGGESSSGFFIEKPNFFILTDEAKLPPDSFYESGVSIITHEYQREIPEAKMINYITAVRVRNRKENKHFPEVLYTWKNNVLEATTSNIFLFKGNTLVTPKHNILSGTTRNFVLSIAAPHFSIEERNVRTEELHNATEVFLTATNKEILPVVQIDGKRIGNGAVGGNTKKLHTIFREKTQLI